MCLLPNSALSHVLATPEQDCLQALEWLADELGARSVAPELAPYAPPEPALGAITPAALSTSIAALLPEHAIVVDESISTGRGLFCADQDQLAA